MDYFRGIINDVDCPSEAAVVLKLDNNGDAPTQHVVATFPTEIFTGNSADKGEMHSGPKHQLAPR